MECAFAAHPSMLRFPGDVEKVALPLSVVVGDLDSQLSEENAWKMKVGCWNSRAMLVVSMNERTLTTRTGDLGSQEERRS